MTGSQTLDRLTQAALEEHQQIHFYLDRILVTLDSLRPGAEDPEPMRRLVAQIEGLKERLTEHYRSEETGGLFDAILEAMPDCKVEVARLVGQHERQIGILEMARIHAQRGEPAEAGELRDDLRRFLDMFRGHERQEDHLLRRALDRTN